MTYLLKKDQNKTASSIRTTVAKSILSLSNKWIDVKLTTKVNPMIKAVPTLLLVASQNEHNNK